MADDARALALKRIEALMAKARDLLKTEQGAEEGRTCAALVLSIIETHGFKVTDPQVRKPPQGVSSMVDILRDMAKQATPTSDRAEGYSTGVSCVYCKKFVMFREQYTEVEGGVVHDQCFEGYKTQRKHYKQ